MTKYLKAHTFTRYPTYFCTCFLIRPNIFGHTISHKTQLIWAHDFWLDPTYLGTRFLIRPNIFGHPLSHKTQQIWAHDFLTNLFDTTLWHNSFRPTWRTKANRFRSLFYNDQNDRKHILKEKLQKPHRWCLNLNSCNEKKDCGKVTFCSTYWTLIGEAHDTSLNKIVAALWLRNFRIIQLRTLLQL